MEIMTIESSAYKELAEKIDRIAEYVQQSEQKKRSKPAERWISGKEVMSMLGISARTLQRLRENGILNYAIFRGACRYRAAEVEQLVKICTVNHNPHTIEEFKHNYSLRTKSKKL